MDELKTAVITGASAGIGMAFAEALAREGSWRLILVARRKDRLRAIQTRLNRSDGKSAAADRISIVPCDLSLRDQRDALLMRIDQLCRSDERSVARPIDLLVNNAGFGSVGSFCHSDLEWQLKMIEVNCAAVVHLCRHLAPTMIEHAANGGKPGTVINIASTVAFQALPYMATYGASKSFLKSFGLALAQELRPSGVNVLTLCPGPTESEFHLVAGLPAKMDFLPRMSAEEVIRIGLQGLRSRRQLLICGRLNALLASLNRLLPCSSAAAIVERILRGVARENDARGAV